MGALASCPLPHGGSPTLHIGGQKEKWPTSGCIGYLTPAVWGVPRHHSGGQNEKWPTSGRIGFLNPAVLGVP